MGPTRPVFGSPSASLPKPPIPGTGVHPFSMKKAVIRPQAMNAAMLGMIMPDRKVPNFCTATRAPPRAGASAVAVTTEPPCVSWGSGEGFDSRLDRHLDRLAARDGVDGLVHVGERQPDRDEVVDRHLAGGDHRQCALVVVRARTVGADDRQLAVV